jgi:hypothetical protein
VSHGRVVSTDNAAIVPSSVNGWREPWTRSISATTQVVSPAWTTTTGQKFHHCPAFRKSPYSTARLGTR